MKPEAFLRPQQNQEVEEELPTGVSPQCIYTYDAAYGFHQSKSSSSGLQRKATDVQPQPRSAEEAYPIGTKNLQKETL